jgi:hypothetical protein
MQAGVNVKASGRDDHGPFKKQWSSNFTAEVKVIAERAAVAFVFWAHVSD